MKAQTYFEAMVKAWRRKEFYLAVRKNIVGIAVDSDADALG